MEAGHAEEESRFILNNIALTCNHSFIMVFYWSVEQLGFVCLVGLAFFYDVDVIRIPCLL